MNFITLCLVSTLVAAVSAHPATIVFFPMQHQGDLQLTAGEDLHPAVLHEVKLPRNLRPEEGEGDLDTELDFTEGEDGTTTDEGHMRFSAPAFFLPRGLLLRNREGFDADAEEGPSAVRSLVRRKRQMRQPALDLALNHNHAVGQVHGRVGSNGVGLGSVLWRSDNNRHSLGAGAYVSQSRQFDGYRYQTRPQYGFGLGYKFRF